MGVGEEQLDSEKNSLDNDSQNIQQADRMLEVDYLEITW